MTHGWLLWLGAPLFLAAAWLVPRRRQPLAMLLVSIGVLAGVSPLACALASGLTVAVHVLARDGERAPLRLLGVLVLCVGAFVALKHDVRLGSLDAGEAGEAGGVGLAVRFGFAYYVLRLLGYALDRYSARQPALGFLELLGYALFFPTLLAGPIHRLAGFQRELRRRRWDAGLASQGAERMLYGLVKIVVLAGYLVGQRLVPLVAETDLVWLQALGELSCYGANLYLLFAGYSDLAIGVALLAGIRVEENFRWPFLATNIADFWRRWHVTLANWCRDHVFTPVSALTRNPYLGVVASMLVLGAWHEPSLRFLSWGVYHGLGIALWQFVQRIRGPRLIESGALRLALDIASRAVTLAFVILSFALTSTPSVSEALALWARLFGLES